MKVPISWLKDYIDIDQIPIEELAHQLTMAGLEVEEIHFIGLQPPQGERYDFKVTGFAWDKEKLVVGEILEVIPHPDADRLVLCRLNDGEREHTVLTGAPNLYEFKGKGPIDPPLKSAYAKEGAQIYDGHKEGFVLTKLKRTKIRGVESYSMICSEKELGISEEHEGIMLLAADAPTGIPLADYLGDAVMDIAITPNIARSANIFGVARETAAIFKLDLKEPDFSFLAEGAKIEEQVSIEIHDPELNPRFVLGLIKNVEIKPSPEIVQRRLRMIDQRPINNIVDATNYVMFDLGQPLHAFDYDKLVSRAGGKAPTIITRRAEAGEKLTTLDEEEHKLEDFTVLVCDTAGSTSIVGIMGGLETEVTETTKNVLLEGANWNYINIRKSLSYLRMHSEASYRFSRGVHPAQAERGVRTGLELMRKWSGGVVSKGLVDAYPLVTEDPEVELNSDDVKRWLGIELSGKEISEILERLGFATKVDGDTVMAKVPDHRVDVDNEPINAKADLMEEIARIFGYENIPEGRLRSELPKQRNNALLDFEENIRDLLVRYGIQETITYRLTSPEREARRLPPDVVPDDSPYVELKNPIAVDRFVLRKSLMASMFEIVESNARLSDRIAIFELGYVYIASEEGNLPDEKLRLGISLTGRRRAAAWQGSESGLMDYFDLKGVVEGLMDGLHIKGVHYKQDKYPIFHPGKCASVEVDGTRVGVIGEISPVVHAQYAFSEAPVLGAFFYLDKLFEATPMLHEVSSVSVFPPVLEDIAVVVDKDLPAAQVEALILQTGGKALTKVHLFDVYQGEQIGKGKKSLAYSLTYQAEDRTLTDKEVAKLRKKIIGRLEREISAKLRS